MYITGLVTNLAILKTKKLLSNQKYELWKRRHTLLLLVYVSLNKRFMLRVKLTVLLQTAISLQTSERSLQYRKIPQTQDILFRIRQTSSFCKYETGFDYGTNFLNDQNR